MILQVILEGLGLGALLVLVCAVGIRKGAVGMVHLYRSEAVHHRKRQTEKMAFRHGGHGSHSGGAGGNDDSTVIGKILLSAAFSGFLRRSGTTG